MYQLSLFDGKISKNRIIETSGIKYTGSKLKLIPFIIDIVQSLHCSTVWDAFSGTTRVSQALAQSGYTTISSDISEWSYVFAQCFLLCSKQPNEYQEIIDYLNSVTPYAGWFTEHYGSIKDYRHGGVKTPWQLKNTMKLDAIRDSIDELSLSEIDKSVVLTSLILALDKVDNTLGHYVSYLKEWSPRSYNDLELEIPKYFIYDQRHKVIKGDIFDLIPLVKSEVVYLDPPYGSNNEKMPPSRVRYASYYHIWTTIIKHDKPNVFGAANRRVDTRDKMAGSIFEEFRRDDIDGQFIAVKAIKEMIKKINANYIILSYSTGGRATLEELYDALKTNGKIINTLEIDYKRNVMSNMVWTNEWVKSTSNQNKELIFVLKKT